MLSFFRILKFAFQDIGRNFSLAFMTVFILVLMLLSVNILWSLEIVTNQATQSVKDQVDISFYFTPKVTDKEIDDVKKYINSFPEVTNLSVINKEQVLNNFKDRHKDQKETMDALAELGENPFGPTVVIKTREPKDYKKIVSALNVPEYKKIIESKSYDQHESAIIKLQNITNRIEMVGLGLTILFVAISFLIIFNTIRVAINSQKTEISIKRLVGANNWFIRGPYLVESVIFTVLSVVVTALILYFGLTWLDSYLSVIFPSGFSLTNYYKSNILLLCSIQTIAVLLLNVLSSGLAMRKQLKV